jgi:hypothetical protein
MRAIDPFLTAVTAWAEGRPDIRALLLVGSWARGSARPDSDVDLLLVVDAPRDLLRDDDWPTIFGAPCMVHDEDWGLAQSRHVFYRNGFEVEFGLTTNLWLSTNPADGGTRRVVMDGCTVLLDPTGAARRFLARVRVNRGHVRARRTTGVIRPPERPRHNVRSLATPGGRRSPAD